MLEFAAEALVIDGIQQVEPSARCSLMSRDLKRFTPPQRARRLLCLGCTWRGAVESQLIAGRDCGSCNVCCVALTIDDPELQKPQGYRCRNTQRDHSCAIYERRPQTCRSFNCSWRQLKWIRDTMRPDISGVLVRMHREISRQTGEERMGVIFMLLTKKALMAEGLAESVAAAVAADVPVYLQVPGPPGYTSSQAPMNDVLRHAVMTNDKPAVLEVLRRARAQGENGERRRIVLKPRKAQSSAPETPETPR
jgi:Fe-S-cluster containining protein